MLDFSGSLNDISSSLGSGRREGLGKRGYEPAEGAYEGNHTFLRTSEAVADRTQPLGPAELHQGTWPVVDDTPALATYHVDPENRSLPGPCAVERHVGQRPSDPPAQQDPGPWHLPG